MESKKCTQCGKDLDIREFSKSSAAKDGLSYRCKKCVHKYNVKNREKIAKRRKRYREKNKKILALKKKLYYELNKKEIVKRRKQYYQANEKKCKERERLYYEKNKKVIIERYKLYKSENKEKVIKNRKQYNNSGAKYKLYYDRLTVEESPRLHDDGVSLEVLCKYCGKYFIPTNSSVSHRLKRLDNRGPGDGFLYCSDNCKTSCPIYRQVKYPKGFRKASSREVNSLVRQMCFSRDDWLCQICGKSIDEVQLHCHHIEGYAQNPVLGNDVYNVITLCKECHKEVHKLPGCNYYELRCKN